MRKPARARCPYCWTFVTGKHLGRITGGLEWGCKDVERCVRKSQAREKKERAAKRNRR